MVHIEKIIGANDYFRMRCTIDSKLILAAMTNKLLSLACLIHCCAFIRVPWLLLLWQASNRVPVPILSSAPGRENTNRRSNHRGGRSRNQRANASASTNAAPHVQKQQHQQIRPVPPPRPPAEPPNSSTNFQPPPYPPPSAPPPGAPPSSSASLPVPAQTRPPLPAPPPLLQAPAVSAPPLSVPTAPLQPPPPVAPLAVEDAEVTSGRRLYERGGSIKSAAIPAAASSTSMATSERGDDATTAQHSYVLRPSPQGVKRMSEEGHYLEQELEKQRSHEVNNHGHS